MMFKSFPILTIIITCLGLILQTCTDDIDLKCTDKNTHKISKIALDYFYFKEGSWWVYADTVDGVKDSIWAYDNSISTDNAYQLKRSCRCGRGKCVEKAKVNFANKAHNGANLKDGLFSYLIGSDLKKEDLIELDEYGDAYFYTDRVRLTFDQNIPHEEPGIGAHIEILPELTILNMSYFNVVHLWYDGSSTVGDWFKEVWYAKNYHLVRFIKKDNSVWQLVKSNIVQ